MSRVIVTFRAEIEAGPESIWFTEDDLASMTDAEVRDLLDEDLLAVIEEGVLTIERAHI